MAPPGPLEAATAGVQQQQPPQRSSSSGGKTKRGTIIALGNSHTRGFYGGCWVDTLAACFPGFKFVNAGRDGEPSETIRGRLPALLAAHPDAVALTLLSGGNDCIAQASSQLQRFYAWRWRLATTPCTQQGALDNIAGMVELVQQTLPRCKIIAINLPIMTEDPTHPCNIRNASYSAALLALMRERFPNVTRVDLQSACRDYMAAHSPLWAAAATPADAAAAATAQQQQQRPPHVSFGLLALACRVYVTCHVQHRILRRSWNAISDSHGLLLTTDQIHMNDRCAGILADLLTPHLQALHESSCSMMHDDDPVTVHE